MALQGLRVVRGPDLKWVEQDCEECNVATVISTLEADPKPFASHIVTVVLDSRIKAQYRAGPHGSYNLRVSYTEMFCFLKLMN